MQGFDFTPSDLRANQAGRLSPRQQEALSDFMVGAHKRMQFAAAVGGLSPLFVVGLVYLFEPSGFEQSIPYLLPTYALYLLILGLALWRGRRQNQILAQGQVETRHGAARLSTAKMRNWTAYYAEIDGLRFQIQPAQFKSLQEGRSYRVHFLRYPPTQWILSIEAA